MDITSFYADREVSRFVEWLSHEGLSLSVDLCIPSSAKVPGGVVGLINGLDQVVSKYKWLSSWTDPSTNEHIQSCNWKTTGSSLRVLGATLKRSLASGDEDFAFNVCVEVLRWGGERNPKQGARKFLYDKLVRKKLVTYLKSTKSALSLDTARLNELQPVEKVNSMLTKVYALMADDELPIYDTRVAVAAAGLVELYRVRRKPNWNSVPDLLAFPVPPEERGNNRRRVRYLNTEAMSPKPEFLGYTSSFTSMRWASAKIRLGWIIREVLNSNPLLLASQPYERHHAFEAAMFMIGYDIRSLAGNLCRD